MEMMKVKFLQSVREMYVAKEILLVVEQISVCIRVSVMTVAALLSALMLG